ncbi:MAG: HAD family hydrolase [Planctomycetota bacterium]|nr:HAD family hydrolase [Planctomycetota bacterium]
MVIGFDIDDTITRHPAFFAFLSRALRGAGHRVVVITYREDRARAAADLEGWGFVWDELVCSTVDLCLSCGVHEWKAVVCREKGVEVFFEDEPAVLRHVDDSVVCLMPVDRNYHLLETVNGLM